MDDILKIVAYMKALPPFRDFNLEYITDEFLEEIKQNAKSLPKPQVISSGPQIAMVSYFGNHVIVKPNAWIWQDGVGDHCESTRTWTHEGIRPGEKFEQIGFCIRGGDTYPFFHFLVYA